MNKRIFIGSAWPYANFSLHLGHVVGMINADVLARYHRQKGDEVLFVSGSDCYGTPIAVEAEAQGIHPSEIAEKYHKEFKETLINGLSFSYDIYSCTTSETHAKVAQDLFLFLHKKGDIYPKIQELPYCEKCKRFLPDRYVEGICPDCGFEGARGDQCDECGNLLSPEELKNAACKICKTKPVFKESEHFFLKLSAFSDSLKQWIEKQSSWRPNAKNFSLGFLGEGLKDRAITRDTEWGVKIPLAGYEEKSIYVWFEALCGYLSASIEWAELKDSPDKWKDFWQKECYHYYVHGKDNILFHTIIWPSILMSRGGLNLPNQIVSSEYLNLEGKQFSKSRKWAVWLPDFLKKFDSDSLRYYLISNGPETSDSNFSWKTFQAKNNTELVDTLGNFVHRVLSFINQNFEGQIPKIKPDADGKALLKSAEDSFERIGGLIEKAKSREALQIIFSLAQEGNCFLDKKEPWKTIKTNKDKAGEDLSICVQLINNLRVLIRPFLPKTSERIRSILGADDTDWKLQTILEGKSLDKVAPLFRKLEDDIIESETQQ